MSSVPKTLAALVFALALVSIATWPADETTPFTAADSLRVKSFSVQSMTDDGRWIAGLVTTPYDRLGVDHHRFGDPTYVAPRPAEAVILDASTGRMEPLFRDKVHAQGMTWSPDGKTLAFFLRKGNAFSLHTYDREKKRLREIRLRSQKAISSNSPLIWTNDGRSLLIALRSPGWEKASRDAFREATAGPVIVYDSREPFLKWDAIRDRNLLEIPAVADAASGGVRKLLPEGRHTDIRIAEDDAFITYGLIHPMATRYGSRDSRQDGREYELFRLDLAEGAEPKILVPRTDKRHTYVWTEDGRRFAWADDGDIFVQTVDETEPRNLTKDKAAETPAADEGKEKPPADKDAKKHRFSVVRWSPDGERLLARTDKGYWLVDPQTGDRDMFHAFSEREEGSRLRPEPQPGIAAWSPDGRYLYMTHAARDRWERGFTRFDLQDRRMDDLVKDSGLYRGLRVSKDGATFLFSWSDGDSPDELVQTGADFKDRRKLTDLNPWIREKTLTRSELVRYLDADGRELFGILYYPVDYEPGKRYPLVCEIYETFFDNGFHSGMNIVANQGWFGLRPSVNLEVGYPGEAWIKGVTSAVNQLIDRGLVDGAKVGVHGTSYGGYATSLLITQTDRFAAAVNIAGKVNIISFLGDSPRIGTRNYNAAEVGQDRIGATLWEQPFKYLLHSAVLFADRIKTPHLLITGEGDWNVPAGNTRELYYALRRLGKTCVWVNYWNAGHGIGAAENEAMYLDKWERVVDWYRTHFEKTEK